MYVSAQSRHESSTVAMRNLHETRILEYLSTCTNNSKAAHEEEEGGEQRGTALVGFRVTTYLFWSRLWWIWEPFVLTNIPSPCPLPLSSAFALPTPLPFIPSWRVFASTSPLFSFTWYQYIKKIPLVETTKQLIISGQRGEVALFITLILFQ